MPLMGGASAPRSPWFDTCVVPCPAVASDCPGAKAEELILQVQRALLIVSKKVAQDQLPKLSTVEVTLKTALDLKGNAGFEFFIITLGSKVTSEETQEIKLTLVPPSPTTPEKSSATDFAKAMADAIIAAALSVDKALKADPPLIMSKLEATFKFAVKREGEGGLKLVFVPVLLNFGAGVSASALHEVKVAFGK